MFVGPTRASDFAGAEPKNMAMSCGCGAAEAKPNQMAQRQFRLALVPSSSPAGHEARCFIELRYRQIFDSEAEVRYPQLLVLSDACGSVAAAVGIRRAADAPLFLEHYLAEPVEKAIAEATGRPASRGAIVELGSFAARSSRAATYLIAAMAAYMHERGFSHALVTSTGRLRRLFAQFEFDLSSLCEARKEALPDGGSSWGHYYDDAPRVLVGSVPQCFAAVLTGRDRQRHAGRRRLIDALILEAREQAAC